MNLKFAAKGLFGFLAEAFDGGEDFVGVGDPSRSRDARGDKLTVEVRHAHLRDTFLPVEKRRAPAPSAAKARANPAPIVTIDGGIVSRNSKSALRALWSA